MGLTIPSTLANTANPAPPHTSVAVNRDKAAAPHKRMRLKRRVFGVPRVSRIVAGTDSGRKPCPHAPSGRVRRMGGLWRRKEAIFRHDVPVCLENDVKNCQRFVHLPRHRGLLGPTYIHIRNTYISLHRHYVLMALHRS